jgi:hypothetical protein
VTRDDIIRMAWEAGIHHAHDSEGHWDGLTDEEVIERVPPSPKSIEYSDRRIVEILERFAALVAAAEREACADIAENWRCNGCPRTVLADEIRARGQE